VRYFLSRYFKLLFSCFNSPAIATHLSMTELFEYIQIVSP